MPVRGAEAFFDLSRRLKAAGEGDLTRELYAGLNRSVKPLSAAIVAAAQRDMPSGYAPVLVPVLRSRASRLRQTHIRLVVSAKGKGEERDVRALDRGVLRHPVYGRSRTVRGKGRVPNQWATTRVERGFVTETFDQHIEQVVDEIDAAVARVAEQLGE